MMIRPYNSHLPSPFPQGRENSLKEKFLEVSLKNEGMLAEFYSTTSIHCQEKLWIA